MFIIAPRAVKFMSILIAICGEDYSILAADSRLTTHDTENKIEYINDDYHKVFKLNDNLLFGGAGQFFYKEPLTAPFIIKDSSTLSLDEADECIQEYMKVIFDKMPPLGLRTYVLCGRNINGEMCLYQYGFNLATQEKTIYKHNSIKNDCDYHCIGLPPRLNKKEDEYLQLIEHVFKEAKSEDDIINGISNIIRSVSELDETVGGEPEILVLS